MDTQDWQLKTPVTFLVFNRPETTARVFERIRQVKPPVLLLVADGPRPDKADDIEKCRKVREIVEGVDWECQVFKNYADSNLGCKQRVSSGLNWVFDTVEQAIILEDDCLPDLSFFSFCQELLLYYRDDERVMVISGNNFQDGQLRTNYSYYFSKYNHCWGWATWRRAWKYWDFNSDKWLEFRDEGLMQGICPDLYERRYWTDIFDTLFLENKPDTWDYAWTFACWSQSGLTALPNVNLVSNIGFGTDATHTRKENRFASMDVGVLEEIVHPSFVVQHKEADDYTFTHHFGREKIKQQYTLLGQFKKRLSLLKQLIQLQLNY